MKGIKVGVKEGAAVPWRVSHSCKMDRYLFSIQCNWVSYAVLRGYLELSVVGLASVGVCCELQGIFCRFFKKKLLECAFELHRRLVRVTKC